MEREGQCTRGDARIRGERALREEVVVKRSKPSKSNPSSRDAGVEEACSDENSRCTDAHSRKSPKRHWSHSQLRITYPEWDIEPRV